MRLHIRDGDVTWLRALMLTSRVGNHRGSEKRKKTRRRPALPDDDAVTWHRRRVALRCVARQSGNAAGLFPSLPRCRSLCAVPRRFGSKMSARKERTFICIKPDGVQRGLVADVIKRFEQKGFKLIAMKFMQASEDLLKEHYADLASRPFYPGLVQYMASGPVVPMVWEGLNAVKTGRVMLGETNPVDSKPGTIRGDYCIQVGRNIVHGSDAVDSANKEIALWFKPEELVNWQPVSEGWVYEEN